MAPRGSAGPIWELLSAYERINHVCIVSFFQAGFSGCGAPQSRGLCRSPGNAVEFEALEPRLLLSWPNDGFDGTGAANSTNWTTTTTPGSGVGTAALDGNSDLRVNVSRSGSGRFRQPLCRPSKTRPTSRGLTTQRPILPPKRPGVSTIHVGYRFVMSDGSDYGYLPVRAPMG